MIILLVALIAGRKKEDEDEEMQELETKKRTGRHWAFWVISLIAGVAAIVLFLLTEDITLPMIYIDAWTIWHVVIFAVLLAFFILGMVKGKTTEEQEATQSA